MIRERLPDNEPAAGVDRPGVRVVLAVLAVVACCWGVSAAFAGRTGARSTSGGVANSFTLAAPDGGWERHAGLAQPFQPHQAKPASEKTHSDAPGKGPHTVPAGLRDQARPVAGRGVEGLWRVTSVVRHPRPFDRAAAGEWEPLTGLSNGTGILQKFTVRPEKMLSRKMVAEVDGEPAVNADLVEAFRRNEGIDPGRQVEVQTSGTFSLSVRPGDWVDLFAAIGWEERRGFCTVRDRSGMVREVPWRGEFVTGMIHYAVAHHPGTEPAGSSGSSVKSPAARESGARAQAERGAAPVR